jgi:hypothetical protein
MGTPRGLPEPRQRALTAVTYLVLFMLGGLVGVIGSFQYARGPVPLVAIALDLAILVTCLLGGWGMRTFLGAIVPALGWFIASFVLSMPSKGSVIITATTAGEWYLYGGALAAAGGGSAAFILWVRPKSRRR